MKLMLDTNVLLEVCSPGRYPGTKEWFRRLLLGPSPPELLVSVVAVYELRRALEHKGAKRSLEHFEELSRSLRFVPVSVEVMTRAVALASAVGSPGDQRAELLDSDVIIAAQALAEGAVLVTTDQSFTAVPGLDARRWDEIDPSSAAAV